MNGVSNEHLIIHLHKKVLTVLSGSTQKKPVSMDDLSKLASRVLGGANILEKFLEQLVAAKAVTRSSGIQEGVTFVAFWAAPGFPAFAKTVATTARPFTAADNGLIKKMHGFMPAQQLLDILNERLVCDLGPDATLYTMDQLYAEIGDHVAVPVGGHDWPSLRKLLAKAERDGVLGLIDEQTINDFAVVFSLNSKQVMVLKDIILQAKEEK